MLSEPLAFTDLPPVAGVERLTVSLTAAELEQLPEASMPPKGRVLNENIYE